MSAAGLNSRLKRLEQVARPDRGVVAIFKNFDETEEEAKARWLAKNPGQSLNEDGLTVQFISFLKPQ